MKTILVAGGAGYIGSHMVYCLIEKGYDVVVADNLSTGFHDAIHKDARFYKGDTRDRSFLENMFTQESIDAVIHMDAFSIVPESMKDPLKYFDNNLIGVIVLLEEMEKFNIHKIVFSTTAAVYGNPKNIPISEDDEKNPINPYGESKLMMESIMKWVDEAFGIKYVALRYFNAAGAHPSGLIGEAHANETHLIPNIMKVALDPTKEFQIFGDDYGTPDGTNIRDYVHILDLAEAHVLALQYIENGGKSDSFNLGSNQGFSVKEIFDETSNIVGKAIPYKISNRRDGDPDILIADSSKARSVLGWHPDYENVHDIIQTAWNWHSKHPHGYGK
ncbi:UDP-glucose 4-epimerase GalE [Companilactobacillus metriopterae]|uniref:UDP-glucose 4-epimerase GalE n=1 Tax=Companilactobacillus metriopterae TaxID=1909267 RepID=UPI00100BB134|nr:UDP-glucose 4-epimerase GalE [Companilactobacillus metriopterae]